ncbi:MAG: hypothetical protein IJ739_00495 [Bacteroidaceae bacterium]|nr:hypothetical protein [Bacteroidaceae bacterium]
MNILGIRRDPTFSPNMSDADTAIFEAVATRLEAQGHTVVRLSDADFQNAFPDDNPSYDPAMERLVDAADRFFTMSRDPLTCYLLDVMERIDHVPCVNTGVGISLCGDRRQLRDAMAAVGVAQPETRFGSLYAERLPLDPEDAYSFVAALRYPQWVKRSYGCTQVREDVVLAVDAAAARRALDDFRCRDIGEVAFCEHVEGDLVKFYGVAGTGFFDWAYADPSHSKFGLEAANGEVHRYAFDASALQQSCDTLAARLGVPVYGGDAIVRADGQPLVIDFNDWPSFSRCREQAAEAIVSLLS